jgi:hypothetical protein
MTVVCSRQLAVCVIRLMAPNHGVRARNYDCVRDRGLTPEPRTRVAKMAEVIAIGASIRIRNLRRCSRPPQETPIPEVHSVGRPTRPRGYRHNAPVTSTRAVIGISAVSVIRCSLPTTYLPTDWLNANKRLRSNSAFLLIAARLLLRWTYIGRPGRLHEFGTQRSLVQIQSPRLLKPCCDNMLRRGFFMRNHAQSRCLH